MLFYNLLCHYGSSAIHIKDQGWKLVNSITEEFHHLTSMQHYIISSYHPQVNGLAEHQNRTTEDCI